MKKSIIMNPTVLITCSTSGIGMATAKLLAKKAYRLILCGRRKKILDELALELSKQTEVTTLAFDVSSSKEVEQAISSLLPKWQEINILINNAGNAHGLSPIAEGDISDWDMMMNTNVNGLLYVSRMVIPRMIDRRSGHIINISSVAAKQTYKNGVVYCASKKAVDAISEGMRLELTEYGIKITSIAPGAVETAFSMVRFKGDQAKAKKVYEGYKALQAEDVAGVVGYAIEMPSHVTIADITIYPSTQSRPETIHRTNN